MKQFRAESVLKKFPAVAVAGLLGLSHVALAATPTNWTTTIDTEIFGSSGSIVFNDWGYVGPAGAGANTFRIGTGFDATRIGQTQNVVTFDPDWLTSDPAKTVVKDGIPPSYTGLPGVTYANASMDATVNFYGWAYTTVGGSTFNNMQIDTAGNYFVAQNDMSFQFYDIFRYHDVTGTNPDQTVDTAINFQPYAISNAQGWCGSTLVQDPNSLAIMAGQVVFDFAFDAYMNDGTPVAGMGGGTQIVPDFVMRSYGSYQVDVTVGNDLLSFTGHAVMNNSDPRINPLDGTGEITDAALDPEWQNRVSFLGAGVVPKGVWVKGSSYNPDGTRKLNADSTWNVSLADGPNVYCDPSNPGAAPEAGAVCYQNSFAGYPFLMRADGQRTLTYINPAGHSDYVNTVPVPAALWLFGSGLLGLAGLARGRFNT